MLPTRLHLLATALCLLLCGNARAGIFTYAATLNGASEEPPVVSLGTGTAYVTYDDSLHTLRVQVSFSGLTGNTTAAHIHGPTATPGVGTASIATTTPTLAGFPGGVTSGTYDNLLDLTLISSWRAGFLTANGGTTAGAEASLAAAMAAGTAYFNIHTTYATSGEIRGFLVVHTPDGGTTAGLLGLSLLGLVAVRRKLS